MSTADKDNLSFRIENAEAELADWLARHAISLLRVSLGVVFGWCGALKLFPGLSPAEKLAGLTISALTGGLLVPAFSVPILGASECLIGFGLVSGRALRVTLAVLLFHMAGTVTPFALLPGSVFADGPFVLTLEGQYIVKNLVLVSGALVVGAAARGGARDRGGRVAAEPGLARRGPPGGVPHAR
jgi:uncharacterized membrane protein YkgB